MGHYLATSLLGLLLVLGSLEQSLAVPVVESDRTYIANNQFTGTIPRFIPADTDDISYRVEGNYFSTLVLPSAKGSCPNSSDDNCLESVKGCKIANQKPKSQCLSFCGVRAGQPAPCSGHGACAVIPGTKSPGCFCDPKYKAGKSPFTCIPA